MQEPLSPELQPLQASRPGSAAGAQPWNLAALQPQVLRALRSSTDSIAAAGGSGTRGGRGSARASADVRVDLGEAGGASAPLASAASAGAVVSSGGPHGACGARAKPGRLAAECGRGSEVVEALLECSTSARWTGDTQGARPVLEETWWWMLTLVVTPLLCRRRPGELAEAILKACACAAAGPLLCKGFALLRGHT